MGPYGAIWAPYGSHMVPFGSIWAHMGPIWAHMGPHGSHMGGMWAPYGPIWAYIRPYGSIFPTFGSISLVSDPNLHFFTKFLDDSAWLYVEKPNRHSFETKTPRIITNNFQTTSKKHKNIFPLGFPPLLQSKELYYSPCGNPAGLCTVVLPLSSGT